MTSAEQRTQRREQWRERVAAFRASGQSVAAWCAAQGIKTHQLRYWLPRLAAEEVTLVRPTRWLPVSVHEPETESPGNGLSVRVGPAVVEVQPGFQPALLTAVVRALMELC